MAEGRLLSPDLFDTHIYHLSVFSTVSASGTLASFKKSLSLVYKTSIIAPLCSCIQVILK